jgi:flagellar M-ring protein FliF
MAEATLPFVGNLSTPGGMRRLSLVLVLVGIVVAIGFIGRWAATPTFVTLYSGLDLKEVGQVADNLAKSNIPYKLGGSGTDIEVPAADIARARVALAKNGLPTNGRPGLELFDKPSWGMTDFTQRVTYQRALEGELGRTIAQIQGVENAEVHLLLPNTSSLRRQDRQAGASVVLSLKGGTPLSPETVQGITYIVSNSVEGLSAENIAVVDNSGRVLSLPSTGLGGTGQTGRQLEVAHGMEQQYVGKIEDLVGTVVGVGRVRAQVSALVSFDQVDATTETYNPDGQVLQTEQRSEGQGTDGSGNQTIVSNQYQNSRRMEKSTSLAGRLTRLTVAVLVDEKSMRSGEQGRQLSDIDAMVRNAVGIDSTRGDRLSVLAVPFEPVQLPAGVKDARPKVDPVVLVERISHPLVGIAAIVVMLLVAMQIKGALTPFRGVRGTGLAGAGGTVAALGGVPGVPGVLEEDGLPPIEDSHLTKMRQRLQHESTERPEITAQVLKAWLAEN